MRCVGVHKVYGTGSAIQFHSVFTTMATYRVLSLGYRHNECHGRVASDWQASLCVAVPYSVPAPAQWQDLKILEYRTRAEPAPMYRSRGSVPISSISGAFAIRNYEPI